MDDRNATLLAGLDRTCPLIEIGPSFAPVAAKADGWATTVLDHAPRDELIAKYTHHPGVDVSRIEEADIVWTGGPLHEAFPPAVREHSWMRQCVSHPDCRAARWETDSHTSRPESRGEDGDGILSP